jgi:hypothetical protein
MNNVIEKARKMRTVFVKAKIEVIKVALKKPKNKNKTQNGKKEREKKFFSKKKTDSSSRIHFFLGL